MSGIQGPEGSLVNELKRVCRRVADLEGRTFDKNKLLTLTFPSIVIY